MDFNNLDELYKRLLPALRIKANEYNNVLTEKEIWNNLAKKKWKYSTDLSLAEMVNDILKYEINNTEVFL